MEFYRYYFSTLSKVEKQAYLEAEAALCEMKSEFFVPLLPIQRLSDIYTMLRCDNPFLFNADSLVYLKTEGASRIKVRPHYVLKKKEYLDIKASVEKRLLRIMSHIPSENDFEKEKFIHDYIVNNVRYDKLKKQYSHEVTGPLCHGVGVCEGMSKLFKLMCDRAQIECICVLGEAFVDESASKKEPHMWNLVCIEGKKSAVDVTYDNSLSKDGIIRYDYFNVSDAIMSLSRSDVMFPVPAAVEGADFYSSIKRSFSCDDDIGPAVRDAFKKPYIAVFRYNSVNTEDLNLKIKKTLLSERRSNRFDGFSLSVSQSGMVELRLIPKNVETENNKC